jgi:hypothetical protein
MMMVRTVTHHFFVPLTNITRYIFCTPTAGMLLGFCCVAHLCCSKSLTLNPSPKERNFEALFHSPSLGGVGEAVTGVQVCDARDDAMLDAVDVLKNIAGNSPVLHKKKLRAV